MRVAVLAVAMAVVAALIVLVRLLVTGRVAHHR